MWTNDIPYIHLYRIFSQKRQQQMYNNMQAIEGISEKIPETLYTVFCQTRTFHNSQKLVSK